MHLSGRWTGAALVLGAVLLLAPPASGQRLATFPDPIRLTREAAPASITVSGFAGRGAARAAVNIGTVDQLAQHGEAISLRYLLPADRFPQELCLALWRLAAGAPRLQVFRVSMLGQTTIPVKAWAKAELMVKVGPREFGPYSTGKSGQRSVTLLVEPSASQAEVKVTGDGGQSETRTVAIVPGNYNRITLAALPLGVDDRELKILLALARPDQRQPVLEVGGQTLPLQATGEGVWLARWPFHGQPPATVAARASVPGEPASLVSTTLTVETAPTEAELEQAALGPARSAPVAAGKRFRPVVGLGVGLVHNTGGYVAPSFSGEGGIDLQLPVGVLALRAVLGVSFASLTVPGTAPLEAAESEVVLLPMGVAVSYLLPLRHFTPYLSAGALAQLARVRTEAAFLETAEQRTEVSFAAFGLAGAQRNLGPGAIFLQAGFRWSRLDAPDLALLAGGIVLDLGYRLYL